MYTVWRQAFWEIILRFDLRGPEWCAVSKYELGVIRFAWPGSFCSNWQSAVHKAGDTLLTNRHSLLELNWSEWRPMFADILSLDHMGGRINKSSVGGKKGFYSTISGFEYRTSKPDRTSGANNINVKTLRSAIFCPSCASLYIFWMIKGFYPVWQMTSWSFTWSCIGSTAVSQP